MTRLFNIYAPQKHSKETFILITVIVFAAISGGYFLSEYFIVGALLFWMHYTAVLSYLQFKKKSKHPAKNFTEFLLNPQIRFFIFVFLGFIGISSIFMFKTNHIGAAVLSVWWLFSLNFYVYYKKRINPEK